MTKTKRRHKLSCKGVDERLSKDQGVLAKSAGNQSQEGFGGSRLRSPYRAVSFLHLPPCGNDHIVPPLLQETLPLTSVL